MKYLQILTNARKEWKNKIAENEWYFSELRELLLQEIDETERFQSLNDIILIIIDENDSYFSIELLELFFYLVKKFNTSEVPIELINNISRLNERFINEPYQKNLWEDIKRFYFLDLK